MIKLSGLPIKEKVLKEVKEEVGNIILSGGQPSLATIQVGDDYGSSRYVNNKIKVSNELNIKSFHFQLDENITEKDLLNLIYELNEREDVTAILVQLPLPKHIDEYKIACAIKPEKDADCFNPYNVGRLYLEKEPSILPCTPSGVIDILKSFTQLEGKSVAVLGRSNIAGKPIAELLIKENATVTLLHTRTDEEYKLNVMENVDIIVSAIGKAEYIKKEMIGQNQILIDIGINRNSEGKQVGDFDYNDVSNVAAACTPPIGGTGACTISKLMKNVVACYKLQHITKDN